MLAKTRHVTARHADKNHASQFLLALPADKNQTGKAFEDKIAGPDDKNQSGLS